ncbi:MAG: hypothetical protein KDI79_21450 [Anaerolineae bacterium]|nr:hypothetical protein [Anaerolineae bacterium]
MTRTRLMRIEQVALLLLILLYMIVANAHGRLAPLTTGPDELAHYEYVNFIAEHGRLPLNSAERSQAAYKSDQPPLYHLITALPASLVDINGPPHLKRYSDHERRPLIEQTRHAWGLHNTEDEYPPYRGEVLRWHIGRWVSIMFGAASIIVTYLIARGVPFLPIEIGPSVPRQTLERIVLALGAAAVIAFIPRFALTGSMLNYETMLAFFAALFLWQLLRISVAEAKNQSFTTPNPQPAPSNLQSPISNLQPPVPHYQLPITNLLLLGLFTGLAITTKLSALILPFEAVVALALIARHYGWPWTRWLRAVAITAAATLVAVSWWFGFIIYQFNTVADDGWWAGLLRPLIAADASDATTNRLLSFLTGGQAGFTAAIDNLESGPPWEWLATMYRTFWVVGIEGHQPLGLVGLLIALALCLIAVFGLIRLWASAISGQRSAVSGQPSAPNLQPPIINYQLSNINYQLLILALASAFILPLIRYAATFSLADTAQGRHILFLAAPAFAILLVWGFTAATRQLSMINYRLSIKIGLPLVPAAFLFFWSLAQLYTMSWAYLPPLPVRTILLPTKLAHPINQSMNDAVTLLGYETRLDFEHQVVQADIYWQATAVSPVDYLTEIKLLDEEGNERSQWLGYPASGRYPTRAWDPGDVIRDTAWLPVGNLEPGDYSLQLNLLPTTTDNPLIGLTIPPVDEPRELGQITLPSIDPFVSNHRLSLTDSALAMVGYAVRQDGVPLTQPATFRYRESIIVTYNTTTPDEVIDLKIVGPDSAGQPLFDPVRRWDNTALFIVGPDWSTGDYRLRLAGDKSPITSEPLFNVIDHWERSFTEPPLTYRLEANFANQVKLLGYDLATRRVQAGGGLPVTMYWQGLDWMGQSYTIFTRLLAADGSAHGGRDRLPREGYRTLYWAPGEIVTDPFGVPVDPDAPDGIYYLNLGLYREADQQAVSLPLVQDGQPIDATSVTIGPIKIGDTPPDFVLPSADPQIVVDQPFGDPTALTLLGYDLTAGSDQLSAVSHQPSMEENQPSNQPSNQLTNQATLQFSNSPNSITLKLYWQSEAPLPTDYTTFVHLRNAAGETVAQKDQPPLEGAYPTSLWDPGEIIADEVTIPLPEELPSGEYSLVVGLYDLTTGLRLPVPDTADNSLRLTTIEVAH